MKFYHTLVNSLAQILVLLPKLLKTRAPTFFLPFIFFSLISFSFFPNKYSFFLVLVTLLTFLIETLNLYARAFFDQIKSEKKSRYFKDFDDHLRLLRLLVWLCYILIATLTFLKFLNLQDIFLIKLQTIKGLIFNQTWIYLFFIGACYLSYALFLKRRLFLASIFFLIGLTWIVYVPGLVNLLSNLGVDSISETTSPNLNNSLFFLHTVLINLPANFQIKSILFYIFLFCCSFAFSSWLIQHSHFLLKRFFIFKISIGLFLIFISLSALFYPALKLFVGQSNEFLELKKNFNNKIPLLAFNDKPLNVLVYIGESTSIMNMSLYGYSRRTTPYLDHLKDLDPNLLVFSKVFSPHTHTSPSLLEGLSFNANKNSESFKGLRKRISLVDMLYHHHIPVDLFSTQGITGSWNRTSSIIFEKASRYFSYDSQFQGNLGLVDQSKLIFDDKFFNLNLNEIFIEKPEYNNKKVVFLHSYAGHGNYLSNIPENFRDPVDDSFRNKNPSSIVGPQISWLAGVEAYDSAIKYIDFSVSQTIEKIKKLKTPAIFIYFSDHGDAPFVARGHDSSRFIHEMARVPFIVYFNDAARKAYPENFNLYKKIQQDEKVSTLAQFPSTLLDLLGLNLNQHSSDLTLTSRIGESDASSVILKRETLKGLSKINLNQPPSLQDISDISTQIFLATVYNSNPDVSVCYHRSNTFAKANRGRLVANCLEVDLTVSENNELDIYHPPAENTKFNLAQVFEIIERNKLALWIDSKNLVTEEKCLALAKFLENKSNHSKPILIEFPSKSYQKKSMLKSCASRLQNSGHFTSYYVPTGLALSCSKALSEGKKFNDDSSCRDLYDDLNNAYDSRLYSDFSFDYGGLKAVENIPVAELSKWNTWGVPPKIFNQLNFSNYRMIILNNDDPNNL